MSPVHQRREFSVERYLREQREKNGVATDKDKLFSAPVPAEAPVAAAPTAPVQIAELDQTEVLEAIKSMHDELRGLKSELRDIEVIPSEDSEMAKDVRVEIAQMVRVIAKTKQEIVQIKHPEQGDADRFDKANSELDEIVAATELATQNILNSTEEIEGLVSQISRRAEGDPDVAEIVDSMNDHLTLILEACNFQDITGQRITKVLKTMRFVEERILAMINIWGAQAFEYLPVESEGAEGEAGDEALLQGPQIGNEGISQAEIDALFD